MSVTKEFATKIDTELASLHDKRWDILVKLEQAKESLKFYQKHYPDILSNITKYEGKISFYRDELFKVGNQILDLDEIYEQDPWTRAFLVVSSNGHVHKDRSCSTCFDTTRYLWLVQYSNDDESTIVEDAGQDACTVCYPSAPAEVLNRPSRIVTADKVAKEKARIERAEKKALKDAKFKANAPTKNGEPLLFIEGRYHRYINTERSAVSYWLDAQWTIKRGGEDAIKAIENCNAIVGALAEKNDRTWEEQLDILEKKYAKRGY